MAIVLDASLIVPLAVDDARASAVNPRIDSWLTSGEELHAPALLAYEVANSLTRLVAARAFPAERLAEAWQTVMAIPITYHELDGQGIEAIRIALRLGRASAYDAAYIALAARLGAELWSFDGPLARNATGLGFPVRLVQ